MSKGKLTLLTSLIALNLSAYTWANTSPHHFFVQMENRSQKEVSISFKPGEANVRLDPMLDNNTPLPAKSKPYGVIIEPMDHKANFNIIFKGKNECIFKVGFYAPGKPLIEIKGLGCVGAGYDLVENRSTLLLFVTDVDLS